jgi:hypothetical protein
MIEILTTAWRENEFRFEMELIVIILGTLRNTLFENIPISLIDFVVQLHNISFWYLGPDTLYINSRSYLCNSVSSINPNFSRTI